MRNLSRSFIKLYLLIVVLGAWTYSSAQIVEVQSISCPGDSNGQLACHADSLIGPLTYLWNTGSTENNIEGLPAGPYSVTITDAGLQFEVHNYILIDPAPISNIIATTPNTTWPANDGTISIVTTGGSGWVNYTVVDSLSRKTLVQAGPNFIGLPSGAYFITSSDVNGCFVKEVARIAETAGYPEIHTIDTTACYADMTSSSVKPDTIPSGIYPIQIYFDGALYETIAGYRRDSTQMYNGVVSVPMLGLGTLVNSPHLIPTSSIMVVPLGPNAGKDSSTIELSSISTTFAQGFHMLEIITADNKGYRYSWVVDSTTSPLSINVTDLVNNVCYGASTGRIIATAEGSYEGITLRLSSPGFTTVTALPSAAAYTSVTGSSLKAGVYTITATDWTAGCARTHEVTVNQPDEPLRIVFDPAKNARCPYSLDGAVSLRRVDGAEGAVSFLWSNGETTPSMTNISPGTYVLTVTDGNGCTGQDSVKIEGERRNCFYNIVTPNGDGYNDQFDLSDFCVGVQMKAVIFNEAGKKITELDELNPTWDAYDPITPPTGTSSTYTCFVSLFENGIKTVEFAESFSVVYSK